MDILAVALGGFLIVVGITHFLVPRYYLSLVPPWVPQARLVIFGSGLVEIAIGVGLLFEGARPVAAWGAAALMAIYVGTHVDALLRAQADEDRWLDRACRRGRSSTGEPRVPRVGGGRGAQPLNASNVRGPARSVGPQIKPPQPFTDHREVLHGVGHDLVALQLELIARITLDSHEVARAGDHYDVAPFPLPKILSDLQGSRDRDLRKVEDLQMAARLSFQAGEGRRGMEIQAAAALLATRQSDVIQASHAWLDAAWVAVEVGEPHGAKEYMTEARVLTTSPLFAESNRNAIRARIVS